MKNVIRILRFFIVFAILGFLILILIFKISPIYPHNYSNFFGSVLASIFTAFLLCVAWEQLGKLNKTSSADFIHKLDNDFFTDETRKLVSLIECEALEFREPNDTKNQSNDEVESFSYFVVNKEALEKTNLPEKIIESISKKKFYSTWEVDDLLLGLCENIGMLEQRGIVNFQMVYDVFSYYLESIWEDAHIIDYIMYCRKEEKREKNNKNENYIYADRFFYNQFQYIALKCIEYDGLHRGPCQWWWKIKRYFVGPKIEWDIYKYKTE